MGKLSNGNSINVNVQLAVAKRAAITDKFLEYFCALTVVFIGGISIYGANDLPDPVLEPIGPATFPIWAGIGLVMLGLMFLVQTVLLQIQTIRSPRETDAQATNLQAIKDPARNDLAVLTIALSTAYGLMLEFGVMGFSNATALFLFSLFVLLAKKKKRAIPFAIVLAIAMGTGLQYGFTQFFYIDLPTN